MKPEEQNIAVAEFLGASLEYHWQCLGCLKDVSPKMVKYNETHDGCGGVCEVIKGPDYGNDLNAINAAENIFETSTLASKFCRILGEVILRNAKLNPKGHCGIWRKVHAKAYERREAFVRTIGKWKE